MAQLSAEAGTAGLSFLSFALGLLEVHYTEFSSQTPRSVPLLVAEVGLVVGPPFEAIDASSALLDR